MISAVAEMYDIHPQTLRLYEREGLLRPAVRTATPACIPTKIWSGSSSSSTLRATSASTSPASRIILQMRERMEEMNRQMQGFVDYVRTEMLTRMQQRRSSRRGLVPLRRPVIVPPRTKRPAGPRT